MEKKLKGAGEMSLSAKMCLLCCENPSLSQMSSKSTKTGFKSFFKDVVDVDVTDDKNGKVEVDLCLNCRSLLTPAVEVHEKAIEIERRVDKLQREILKELKNLQGQLGQFYVEMKKVGKAIQKFPKRNAEAEVNVNLRQKLFGVVRDLQLFNAEFSPKVMLCKIDPSGDNHHGTLEVKYPGAVKEGTRQMEVDTFEDLEMEAETESNDFGFSIDNQSDDGNGIEEVNETKPDKDIPYGLDSISASKRVKTENCDQQQQQQPQRKQGDLSDPNDFHQKDVSVPIPDDDDDPDEVEGDNHISAEEENGSEVESEEEIRRKNRSRKRRRQIPSSRKLCVTKGMRPFKKSVVSRIISTKGVTFLSPSKRRILMEPFRQNPMKFDSKTDTFSVGEIQILLDERGKSLECSRCSMKFVRKERNHPAVEFLVHEHILGHHLETLKCPICNKRMTTFSGLTMHLRGHQEKVFCDICGRPFPEKRKMVRHKITHMNAIERAEATARGEGKTFECYLIVSKKERNCSDEVISKLKEIIGKEDTSEWKRKIICRIVKTNAKQTDKDSPATKFPIVYDQATDKLSVSGVEIIMNETEVCLECSSCSVKFHGQSTLQMVELNMHNHILSKHLDALRCPFPAEQCTARIRSFETLFKYNLHLRNYHPKDAKEKQEKEKAVCEVCGKIFKSGGSLSTHRRKLHGKVRIRKPKSTRRLDLPLKHKCSTCGKGFWERNPLKRHEVSHLPREQRNSFICNRCGKKFLSVHHFNHHQKVSCFEKGQELPRVPCQFCSRTLKNKEQLQKHIATMHPEQNLGDERPFQCSMCPQRFKTEWSMEAHERIRHSVAEGENQDGSGYRCRKGCGKQIPTAHGRMVHESYCNGEGCKTERERSKSKKKIV